MTQGGAEDALRRACDAVLIGDMMTAMQDLSPEAFGEAMIMGANITALPTPVSYEVESREVVDGDERFVVRFKTSAQDIITRSTWRQLDGAWKIVSISAEGLQA
jgi:hypothetical protein